jgi:ADP-heptose:LPS heptosyltransferase/lauroyl/myristoyl acyltransferase
MRSNLHHAFPEKSDVWRKRVAHLTSERLIEMAVYSLMSPYLSKHWYERHFEMASDVRAAFREAVGSDRGGVILMPHVCLNEMMTSSPTVLEEIAGQPIIYRPNDQPAFDRWLKRTRERWGMKLLSRKDGLREVSGAVRSGKLLTILFDQNSGKRGYLFHFMNRLASGTHLPGLLCQKFKVPAYMVIPKRVGFLEVKPSFERLPDPEHPADLILTSHQALEDYLRGSEEQCAEWLWFHNRWRTRESPRRRFSLRANDNYVAESLLFQNQTTPAKRFRIWIRMPNWLGDVVMAIPLIRALRGDRPDAQLTLVANRNVMPLLKRVGVADQLVPLPDNNASPLAYFRFFYQQRHNYVDTVLCLTNSTRGDLEAWLTRAPQRFGMLRPNRRRPLLSRSWPMPADLDETQCHQTEVWEEMFRFYGLQAPLDRSPFLPTNPKTNQIGLICGTENSPKKRWPVPLWQELTTKFVKETDVKVHLFGTANDRSITKQVANALDSPRVIDEAGKTNLEQFMERLAACRVVICNDTGGMHLANMLGVPVIAIFGPTNPLRTGPVFQGETHILQPPGCPGIGGADIKGVTVARVWQQWEALNA